MTEDEVQKMIERTSQAMNKVNLNLTDNTETHQKADEEYQRDTSARQTVNTKPKARVIMVINYP